MFEYKVVMYNGDDPDRVSQSLTELAKEGWKVISVNFSSSYNRIYYTLERIITEKH